MLLLAACRYRRFETRREHISPSAKADVIVVPGHRLGAAGEASPILRRRVRMASLLVERGVAPRVLFSGGKPRAGVTEAEKMAALAVELGLPPDAVSVETRARSSFENGRFSAELMAARGWKSAVVVSDANHLRYLIPVFSDAFRLFGLKLYWTPGGAH